jgi:hypothetical protein
MLGLHVREKAPQVGVGSSEMDLVVCSRLEGVCNSRLVLELNVQDRCSARFGIQD